jgi:hypothetical protein
MKGSNRFWAVVLFLAAGLGMPALLRAQSPFDGTWHTNLDQAKFSPKPIDVSLANGLYDCSSCNPKIHVKADGRDQPVSAQPYDTISVREVDSKSIEIVTKKNGKPETEQIRAVSADGQAMTVRTTTHSENSDQAVTAEATLTRIGTGPAGANGTSGSWRIDKVSHGENGLNVTYKSDGDGLRMSTASGESYTAKLDGKSYPVKGAFFYDSVSLRRIDDHTIEETDKRDGKVVQVSTMTVASDGKTMTVVSKSALTGRTSTFVAEKQ